MTESVALAHPHQLLAVLEEMRIVAKIDPVRIRLAQNRRDCSRLDTEREQFKPVLYAIHTDCVEVLRIRHPANAGDQIGISSVADIQPSRGPTGGRDHTQAHVRIVLAGLRVTLRLKYRT